MKVSVIIAVFNRAALLPDLLEHWRKVHQATKYEYELIFTDDESSDHSVAILEQCKDLPITVLKNRHGGAAKARNNAYRIARGELIIFTGDDIFPEPNFVNEHYESYLKNGSGFATLGRIDWRDGIAMNHLMKHITDIGCEQFGFVGMRPFEIIDFRHFYTSNVSVAKSQLDKLEVLFDEGFEKYGFEDVELGYRLYKNGVQIYYNPAIHAYHDHIYSSVDKFCQRQLFAGEELNEFKRMHPELTSEEIKFNIDEFNSLFEEYVAARRKMDVICVLGRAAISVAKASTKLLEKIIQKKKHIFFQRLCSFFYRVIFSYYMNVGLAKGYQMNQKFTDTQAKNFAFRYLFFGKLQLFYNFDGSDNFAEENSFYMSTVGRKKIYFRFDLAYKGIRKYRLDPLNHICRARVLQSEVLLEDGTVRTVEIICSNGEERKNNSYYFYTKDPILVSDQFPEGAVQLRVEYEISYLLGRRAWGVIKSMIKLLIRAVKKAAKLLLRGKTTKKGTVTVASAEQKCKIWVTVSGSGMDERLAQYQQICAVFADTVVTNVPCGLKEYREYVYRADVKDALDRHQFANAVLCLSKYQYDFVVVSDGLEEYPMVKTPEEQGAMIVSRKLEGLDRKDFPAESQGRFIRLPGSRRTEQKADFSRFLPTMHENQGVLCAGRSAGLSVYQQIDIHPVQKHKPVILVLPVFMAVGGVERNTVEVMNRLHGDYDFVVVTFERHRTEQGSLLYQLTDSCLAYYDFAEIASAEAYLSLLSVIRDAYQPDAVWICNSSPWFMDNSSNIRGIFCNSAIVTQDVYDYTYGWIEYYDQPGIHSYDRFIAINKKIEDTFIQKYHLPSREIDLIYPAADTEKIQKMLDENIPRAQILEKYGLNPNKKYFVFVGRFTRQKQPRKVVELAKHAAERFDDVDFVMVGDGELSDDVDAMIASEHLENRVHRIKYIANVCEFTKCMEGLVITSIYEGLPIVTIEAMCVGTPIMGTDVGDLALFIKKFNIGVISESQEMKEIIKAFDAFVDNLDVYRGNTEKAAEENRYFFSAHRAAMLMKDCFEKAMSKYKS